MHPSGPIAPAAAVCSWREASPSNRWPLAHSSHGGRTRNPARVPHQQRPVPRAESAGGDPRVLRLVAAASDAVYPRIQGSHRSLHAKGGQVKALCLLVSCLLVCSDQIRSPHTAAPFDQEAGAMTTAQASIGQIRQRIEVVSLAYHGLCEAARGCVSTGARTKKTPPVPMTAAPAGGVSKAKDRHGEGGGARGPGCVVFVCSGPAAIGPQAMNQRQRRDEKGRGETSWDDRVQQGAERAMWAGRRNVS